MKKDLYNLNKVLKNLGYFKEAKIISGLIKVAVPIIDILEMPNEKGIKENEEGDIEIEYDEPRRNIIQEGRYPIENWYGALKELGANVILIPFSEKKLNYNEMALYKLGIIFGVYEPSSYKEIRSKANLFFNSEYKRGSLNILKELFPTLWSAISKKLNELDLKEEQAVYMFYNEDEKKPFPEADFIFSKDPKYLSHDIGHIAIESDENYDFKKIIYDFIEELSKCYVKESHNKEGDHNEDETLYKDLKEQDEEIPEEIFDQIIPELFTTFSPSEADVVFDVFSNCLAGDPEYNRPRTISYGENNYILDSKKEGILSGVENKFYREVDKYAKDEQWGPLAQYKGLVLLFDN